MSKYILFFDEINKNNVTLVGGKGANLGEMTNAKFPVPCGFCITTKAYQDFIEYNQIQKFITEFTNTFSDIENIKQFEKFLREKFQQGIMPEAIKNEIIQALNKIGEFNAYAVRSSATTEDLEFNSSAGQHETYLNIIGIENLLEAIKSCWASLFTERAIFYRLQNNIDQKKVSMGVVIQKMIFPEMAGIMFTADPVSGHRGIISIDASFGLGEAVVSGLVTPDLYKIRKSDLQIETKIIAEKKISILPNSLGGTRKEVVTEEKSKSQVLDDSQIKKLAELGAIIEKHYGCPQDIEWCIEKNNLYIVQSRAISSLFPLPYPLPQDSALHIYFSANHLQNMLSPISPMGIDLIRMIIKMKKNKKNLKNKNLVVAAGRLYVDVSNILKIRMIRPAIMSVLLYMDALLVNAIKELVQRPDFEKKIKKNKFNILKLFPIVSPVIFRVVRNIVFMKPEGTVERMNKFIEEQEIKFINALNGTQKNKFSQKNGFDHKYENLLNKKNDQPIQKILSEKHIYEHMKYEDSLNKKNSELIDKADDRFAQKNLFEENVYGNNKDAFEIEGRLKRLENIHEISNIFPILLKKFIPVFATGVFSFKALRMLEKKILGTNNYSNIISKGLEGNITTETGLLLGDLADQIRKSPVLISTFENDDPSKLFLRINQLEGFDEFKKDFNKFLQKHGTRAIGEIDISRDRWIESPELLVNTLMAVVHTSQEGAHRKEYNENIKKGKIALAELIKEVEKKHGKFTTKIVARLARFLRNVLPIREHHKYLIMKIFFVIKNILLEEGELLVKNKQLEEAKDVFYLEFQELCNAIQNNEEMRDLVKRRKEKYCYFAKLNAPRIMTSEGEEIKAGYNRKDLPLGAFPGIAASSGVIEGIAKIITDPTKETLNKGEILIASFTDPGWTPLFVNAAGLVIEIGGLLTHGTVIAREYGIPAVVGVEQATKKIKTGQKIRVDGNSGFVLIIND